MREIYFDEIVELLQDADLVIVVAEGVDEIASYVGWLEEGDESSPFTVGTKNANDIYISRDTVLQRDGARLIKPHEYTLVLYRAYR